MTLYLWRTSAQNLPFFAPHPSVAANVAALSRNAVAGVTNAIRFDARRATARWAFRVSERFCYFRNNCASRRTEWRGEATRRWLGTPSFSRRGEVSKAVQGTHLFDILKIACVANPKTTCVVWGMERCSFHIRQIFARQSRGLPLIPPLACPFICFRLAPCKPTFYCFHVHCARCHCRL